MCARRFSFVLLLLMLSRDGGAGADSISVCEDRAHCEWAADLSQYLCGYATGAPAVARHFGSALVAPRCERAPSPAPCTAPYTPRNASCVARNGTLLSDNATEFGHAAGCEGLFIEGHCLASNSSSRAECEAAGHVLVPGRYPTLFVLCTLGEPRGCRGAEIGKGQCALSEAQRAALQQLPSATLAGVGDPFLAPEVAQGIAAAAQQAGQHVSTFDPATFSKNSLSSTWQRLLQGSQCTVLCQSNYAGFNSTCLERAGSSSGAAAGVANAFAGC